MFLSFFNRSNTMHSKQRDCVAAILVLMLQIVMTYCTDIDDVCYSGNADKLPLMIRLFCDQLGSLENNVDTGKVFNCLLKMIKSMNWYIFN